MKTFVNINPVENAHDLYRGATSTEESDVMTYFGLPARSAVYYAVGYPLRIDLHNIDSSASSPRWERNRKFVMLTNVIHHFDDVHNFNQPRLFVIHDELRSIYFVKIMNTSVNMTNARYSGGGGYRLVRPIKSIVIATVLVWDEPPIIYIHFRI
jgi:hypothetical protein